MDQSLYHHSLYIAIPLMLFFGLHMLFARTPEKKIFSNFLQSRRLMGTALLILAFNYAVHFFFDIRLKDVNATILMNLSTYFLCYWLFSSAMMTLLERSYITRQRFICHISLWLAFSALACLVTFPLSETRIQSWGTVGLAVLLVGYGLFLSVRLLRAYTRAIKMFEDTHSDDIGSYIRWLSVFTYWAIGFGVSCGLLTFLPDEFVFIWILSSIPFYVYLYCCYQNYMLFYEQVENAFQEDLGMSEVIEDSLNDSFLTEDNPACHSDIERRVKVWMDEEGYRKPGITISDLSTLLCTNRTYLSAYIKNTYHMNFRDWIADLRIEYAKRLMKQQPQMKIQEVSVSSGFLSMSHFTRIFKAKEGRSPARWRSARQPPIRH